MTGRDRSIIETLREGNRELRAERDAAIARAEQAEKLLVACEAQRDFEIKRAERTEAVLEEVGAILDDFEKSRCAVSVLLYRIRDRIALTRGE